MKKRKALALLMSTAMVASIATGCGSSNDGGSGSGSNGDDGQKKLVITYVDPSDNGEDAYMYKWIMDTYEKWDRKD